LWPRSRTAAAIYRWAHSGHDGGNGDLFDRNAALLFALGFSGRGEPPCPQEVLGLAGRLRRQGHQYPDHDFGAGAINGMVFTTARIYSEFGSDHRFFQPLSKWSRRWGTPGARPGDASGPDPCPPRGISAWVSLDVRLNVSDGFEKMIEVTAAVFLAVLSAHRIALFMLRAKDADLARPSASPLSVGAADLLPVVRLHGVWRDQLQAHGIVDRSGHLAAWRGILLPAEEDQARARVPEPSAPVPAGALY